MAGAYEIDTRATQLREFDYGDAITRVYDREFHLFAMLNNAGGKKRKLKQVFASWRAGIPGPAIDPGVGEGVDKTDGYGNQQAAILQGWAQIMRSVGWQVTPTEEEVVQADVASEISEQKDLDEENFIRACERVCGSTQAQSDGSNNGIRRTGGLFWWLSPNPGGTNPPPANVRVASNAFYTGTLTALTETVFTNTILAAIYAQVNKPMTWDMRAGLKLKQTMSNWGVGVNASTSAQIATRNIEMSDLHKKWIASIEFFQWDVGMVSTWLNQNLACSLDSTGAQPEWLTSPYTDRSGLILNPNQPPRLRYLRPMYSVDQDPNNTKGGGRRGFTEMEAMVYMPVPMGQGAVYTNAD
jgi:hypothetical protein